MGAACVAVQPASCNADPRCKYSASPGLARTGTACSEILELPSWALYAVHILKRGDIWPR